MCVYIYILAQYCYIHIANNTGYSHPLLSLPDLDERREEERTVGQNAMQSFLLLLAQKNI